MKYEQLERCYKNILRQRDEAEVKIVELQQALDKFENSRNWTRSHNCYGDLIKEHALYIPKLNLNQRST